MIVRLKNVLLITLFAIAHGVCCVLCRSLNTEDSFVLTLLTIAMIFLICNSRKFKWLQTIVAILLSVVFAYIMGNAIPKLLCLFIGMTMWTNTLSTVITTLVLGFGAELIIGLVAKPEQKNRWIVRLNDRIVPINTEQVAYFVSIEKFNYLVTKDGVKYVVDSTMDSIYSELDSAKFFRINRGSIVSLSCIDSVVKDSGRYVVQTVPPSEVQMTIVRSKVDAFLKWLA